MAIDIYNNDIYVTGDDFIEGDGGVHNIRIMRNRGVNAAHTALSAQPIFGEPRTTSAALSTTRRSR